MTIKIGVERLINDPSFVKGKRVGLIANATSVDKDLVSTVNLLQNHPDINLTTLFGPQQGFWGETQDNMVEWRSGKYPRYDLPLYSLYGETRKPTEEMLKNIDVLIFDVQDVGTRVYTYIWTMVLAMEACAELGKEFIVCDRPNPINGVSVEGNVSSKEFASFVAFYPLPLRHGMTCGEVARYVNEEFKISCELTVIEMEGWKRKMWFDETGLSWIIPSANLPTLDSATVYPGTVIFEGTNISEGRGTTRPFEFIGAPFINGFDLADQLNKYNLPGTIFRPCIFIPTFQKHTGKNCGGIQIHITERKTSKPVETAITILKMIKELYPSEFKWSDPPYEYTHDKPPIDMIFGSDFLRKSIDNNTPLKKILEKTNAEITGFKEIRKKYLLY